MEIEDHLLTATEKEASKIERPLNKKQMDFFWWIILITLVVFASRIFYLNVVKGSYYEEISQGNRVRSVVIQAPRGKIFDRHGQVLVNNVPGIDAIIIPADLPRDPEAEKEFVRLTSDILGINEGEVLGKIGSADRASLKPVLLKESISQDQSLMIAENTHKLPGLMFSDTAVREYIDGYIFSHILGYEGKVTKSELEENPGYLMTDYIGKQGIEKFYEKNLRGAHGARQIEVDSLGKSKREIGAISPSPGSDIVLSLDSGLQKKIFDELSRVLETTETKTAAAVAINPKNGGVLALVSLPSYDNNVFVRGISAAEYNSLIGNPDKPLFNRAIAGEYPPGSTLKPIVALAALEEGVINEETTVSCTGAIHVGSYRFGDWKTHGATDIRKAIAESCNVFFYSIGGGYGGIAGLGMSKMKKYEDMFGLGKITGLDISGERPGFIPDEDWKSDKFGEKWYSGDSYHASIGQGYITTTPLQLANSIAAIANGGTLYKPHFVQQIKVSDEETLKNDPEKINAIPVSWKSMRIVQEGMRQTVTSGSAQSLNTLPVEAAGKTGTSQFGSENKTHAWFVSYAPFDNPEIAMAVLVEGGGEGSSSAVPATRAVYDWYFSERK